MQKSINIFNQETGLNNAHFYSDLESELWNWSRCFNCTFCWDIISETWRVKDAIIECMWSQAWINNIHISSSCGTHNFVEDYPILRKWD